MISIKKNNAKTLYILAPVFFLCCHIFPSHAEEGRIIKIEVVKNESSEMLKIDPAELTVEKDVIVIWLNSITDQEVNILFRYSDLPETAVTDPMGFDKEKNNIYAAKYLPFIATASLRFIKEGIYSYTVEMKNGKCSVGDAITVIAPKNP